MFYNYTLSFKSIYKSIVRTYCCFLISSSAVNTKDIILCGDKEVSCTCVMSDVKRCNAAGDCEQDSVFAATVSTHLTCKR